MVAAMPQDVSGRAGGVLQPARIARARSAEKGFIMATTVREPYPLARGSELGRLTLDTTGQVS